MALMEENGVSLLIPEPDEWRDVQPDPPPADSAELAELLSLPPEERAGMLAEERFRKTALVEALLQTSRDRQLADPGLSEHLASLAGQLAGQVPEIRDGDRMAAFLTRAAVLMANARRLTGNLAEAERAFAHSLFYSAPPAEQALFHRTLGLIRWEQGRRDEAASLLEQSSRLFSQSQLLAEDGATQILLGLLHAERGNATFAMVHLTAGLAVAVPEDRPWLIVRGALSLAVAFDDQGGRKMAVDLLAGTRRLELERPAQARLPQSIAALRKLIRGQGHRFEPLPFA